MDTISIKLARAMKVSGKTIDKMDTGLNNGVMVHGTKGCMQMERRMAQATSCGMIPRCLQENSKTTISKVKESTAGRTDEDMREIGSRTKWMVTVHSIGQMAGYIEESM